MLPRPWPNFRGGYPSEFSMSRVVFCFAGLAGGVQDYKSDFDFEFFLNICFIETLWRFVVNRNFFLSGPQVLLGVLFKTHIIFRGMWDETIFDFPFYELGQLLNQLLIYRNTMVFSMKLFKISSMSVVRSELQVCFGSSTKGF